MTPEDKLRFIAFLEETLQFIDRHTPTLINSGGCGVFADLLTDELDKRGVEYQIIAFWEEKGKEIQTNTNNFLNNAVKPQNPHKIGVKHICVKLFDLFYVDSHGVESINTINADLQEVLTKSQLKALDDVKEAWNNIFDRECVKDIQVALTEVFNRLDSWIPGTYVISDEVKTKLTAATVHAEEDDDDDDFVKMLDS
jgi:hypothetical protein